MATSHEASPSAPAGRQLERGNAGGPDSGLILSLDPGQRKLGWALVDFSGKALALGIWPESSWEERLVEQQQSGALA